MNIILGVCGSISAYKAYDILRGLLKNGHQVRVVCTRGSEKFVIPQVFHYLGAQKVYSSLDDFHFPHNQSAQEEGTVLHIHLAKWAEKIVVCPLSANTLASLAHGMANDLLTSLFLACPQTIPILLFPAMNTSMYQHPITQENKNLVQKIQTLPQIFVHPPESGLLACGDFGIGKLPTPEKIIDSIEAANPKLLTNQKAKKVLITTGATLAPLDPVRYLTNASSGITGFYLATEALKRGFQVCVIAGKNASKRLDHLIDLPGYELVRVSSADEMAEEVFKRFDQTDIYLSPAAISDIKFPTSDQKIKKENIENSLPIEHGIDILKSVIQKKKSHQKIIGFAAETELTREVLEKKWKNKPVDLLIGTLVHHGHQKNKEQQGFNTENAFYKFFENSHVSFEGHLSKQDLSKEIIKRVYND